MNRNKPSIKINAVFNFIKQLCNIAFPLITYPYISRVLGSGTLGRFSFADSIVQYGTILATLGASAYAIREGARIRNDKEASVRFAGEILAINMLSLLLSAVALLCVTLFVDRIGKERILIAILSINMFAMVLGRDWINSIYEDYLYIMLRYVIFQIIAIALMFLFVKRPEDVYVYAVAVVVGNAGAQFANMIHTSRILPIRLCFSKQMLRHLRPILYLFCTAVGSIIYINSDVTLLGFFRPDEEVGVYYMVGKIYTIIKALMNAIIVVCIPRLSHYLANGETEKHAKTLVMLKKYLFTLLLPSIVGLFMLSENVLLIVGGTEFVCGKTTLRILCGAMFFAVYACYCAQAVLLPLKKESVFFIATMVSALTNILLNLVLIPFIGMAGAALTTLLSEIIVVFICKYHFRGQVDTGRGVELSVIVGVAAIVLICIGIKLLKLNFWVETGLAVGLSVMAYGIILVVGKNEAVNGLLHRKS